MVASHRNDRRRLRRSGVRRADGVPRRDGRDGAAGHDAAAARRWPRRRRRCRPTAGAVALTLCDHDTPLWLDPALAGIGRGRAWLGFHTGAPLGQHAGRRAFRAGRRARPSLIALENFAQGTQEYPDRSTTLILQVDEPRRRRRPLLLEGPGIETHARRSRRRRCRAISSSSGSRTARAFRAASTSSSPRPTASPACRAPRASDDGGLSHVCRRQGRRSRHRQCPPAARRPPPRRPLGAGACASTRSSSSWRSASTA